MRIIRSFTVREVFFFFLNLCALRDFGGNEELH